MELKFDDEFWFDENNEKSRVFQIFPDVFGDVRGSFSETWKFVAENDVDKDVYSLKTHWIFKENWIRQINTSHSGPNVLRGFHAQSGDKCQAKLVSALTLGIFDIILDARPTSETFGKSKVFFLNPRTQNKLFVPRGFLHAFLTGEDEGDYIFQYMCDNVYSKANELGAYPYETASATFGRYCNAYGMKNFLSNRTIVSAKDMGAIDMDIFLDDVKTSWDKNGALWYK